MKNSTSFKSVQEGNKVRLIDHNNIEREGIVVCVKRASFTVDFKYMHDDGRILNETTFFRLKDGSYGYQAPKIYQNETTPCRCLEIL